MFAISYVADCVKINSSACFPREVSDKSCVKNLAVRGAKTWATLIRAINYNPCWGKWRTD